MKARVCSQREFKNRRKDRNRLGNEAEVFFPPKSASLRRRLPFSNLPCLCASSLLGAGLFILGLLCGCRRSNSGTEPGKAAASPRSVQIVHAHPGEIARSITLPAEIKAYQQATLYAKVGGCLKPITVERGNAIKPGLSV